jgi:hypothetical protein
MNCKSVSCFDLSRSLDRWRQGPSDLEGVEHGGHRSELIASATISDTSLILTAEDGKNNFTIDANRSAPAWIN